MVIQDKEYWVNRREVLTHAPQIKDYICPNSRCWLRYALERCPRIYYALDRGELNLRLDPSPFPRISVLGLEQGGLACTMRIREKSPMLVTWLLRFPYLGINQYVEQVGDFYRGRF